MGKTLIQQARGKGSPRYRAPSFRYKAEVRYLNNVNKGTILDFIKCQGHSAPLAEIKYDNGEIGHVIAAEGLKVGEELSFGDAAVFTTGSILTLKDIPLGTNVFNIESMPGDGGKFVRSGGVYARVVGKFKDKIVVELPSKKQRDFHPECRASIGVIAGAGRTEKPFLKASTKAHAMSMKNKIYPRVKGQSMNAVDHPHGTSRSSKKGQPTIARRNAPPGAKVGKLWPRRTGKRR
jgi:large subunit ribosomal protein L2